MVAPRELEVQGDEIRLTTHYNTDELERENWIQAQQGKGFIRDKRGQVVGRLSVRIPVAEANHLWAALDYDWLLWQKTGDEGAFHRLLKRFPWWRCAEGGI